MPSNSPAYYKQYDQTPPTDAPEVARIMQERGVGRRRATHLLTKARAETIDVSDVGMSQKELVLATLVKHGDIKNSDDLGEHLRHTTEVNHTNGHDVVKMLWACQKMGWITFRERKANSSTRPAIYGIRVTDKGYSAASAAVRPKPVEMGGNQWHLPEAAQSAQNAKRLDGDPPPTYDEPPVTKVADLDIKDGTVSVTPASDLSLESFPILMGLLKRADKADQLEQAAEILEAAGEEDMALQVMGKIEFSPLEKEAIALARVVWKEV